MNHTQNQASGSGDKCPVCGGTGWELYEKMVDGYDTPLEYSRPCSRCKGIRRVKDETGIPPQFCEADIYKFDFDAYNQDMSRFKKVVWWFFENFETCVKSGKGLYLWSKTPGSGKTFLSCCVARSLMVKYDLRMRFVTAPDYLAAVGESYKKQEGMTDKSQVFRECALLVLDDLGTQKTGDWQQQELFRLINERSNAGKLIIFTSNMLPEKLNVDSRTIDRIRKMSIVLQMPEESIRLKKAQAEQNEFLRRIFPDEKQN